MPKRRVCSLGCHNVYVYNADILAFVFECYQGEKGAQAEKDQTKEVPSETPKGELWGLRPFLTVKLSVIFDYFIPILEQKLYICFPPNY